MRRFASKLGRGSGPNLGKRAVLRGAPAGVCGRCGAGDAAVRLKIGGGDALRRVAALAVQDWLGGRGVHEVIASQGFHSGGQSWRPMGGIVEVCGEEGPYGMSIHGGGDGRDDVGSRRVW